MKRLLYIYALPLMVFSACSSAERKDPRDLDAEDYQDKVISRMNQADSRPAWLDESKSFWVSGGDVFALGRATLPGDGRVEMGYRIAENNAKVALASAIELKLESVFQAAEEGAGIDASQYRNLGSEITRMTTSSLRVGSRYWERVLSRDSSGGKALRYEVFAIVSMPQAEFRSAILAALRKASHSGVTDDFANKVNQQWDRITREDERAPASRKAE